MIYSFLSFLNESGISNIIKHYADIIIDKYLNKQDTSDLTLDNEKLPLYNTNIEFIDDDKNSAFIPKSGVVNNALFNTNFKIYTKGKSIVEITDILKHEFTHAIEYFNLMSKGKKTFNNLINIALTNSKHDENSNLYEEFKKFDVFRRFVYLTLDKELNARVAEIHTLLLNKNSKDPKILKKELFKSEIWENCQAIKNFNPNKMHDYLIDRIGEPATLSFIKEFNTSFLKVLKDKKTKLLKDYLFVQEPIENIIDYFNKWNKVFQTRITKHEEKLLKMIDVVISDRIDAESYNTQHPETPEFFKEYLNYQNNK